MGIIGPCAHNKGGVMKTKTAISWGVAGASILSVSTSAYAGGLGDVVEESVVAPPDVTVTYDRWDGLYVGAHVGAGTASTTFTGFDPTGPDIDEGYIWPDNTAESDAVFGGFQVGYNFQNGNLVYGAELDYGLVKVDPSEISLEDEDIYAWRQVADIEGIFTLRGRVGYSFDNRALLYATAGLAAGMQTVGIQARDGSEEYSFARNDDLALGGVVGAGLEYAINDRWSIKGEGLFFRFANEDEHLSEYDDGDVYAWGAANDNTEFASIRLGVNYRY